MPSLDELELDDGRCCSHNTPIPFVSHHRNTDSTALVSGDKKKTYCLYEALSADVIRTNAARLNIPADVVVEVTNVNPGMFAPTIPSKIYSQSRTWFARNQLVR